MAFSKVTLNGTTLMDIRDTTATATDVRVGMKFYGPDGEPVIGEYADGVFYDNGDLLGYGTPSSSMVGAGQVGYMQI